MSLVCLEAEQRGNQNEDSSITADHVTWSMQLHKDVLSSWSLKQQCLSLLKAQARKAEQGQYPTQSEVRPDLTSSHGSSPVN